MPLGVGQLIWRWSPTEVGYVLDNKFLNTWHTQPFRKDESRAIPLPDIRGNIWLDMKARTRRPISTDHSASSLPEAFQVDRMDCFGDIDLACAQQYNCGVPSAKPPYIAVHFPSQVVVCRTLTYFVVRQNSCYFEHQTFISVRDALKYNNWADPLQIRFEKNKNAVASQKATPTPHSPIFLFILPLVPTATGP